MPFVLLNIHKVLTHIVGGRDRGGCVTSCPRMVLIHGFVRYSRINNQG